MTDHQAVVALGIQFPDIDFRPALLLPPKGDQLCLHVPPDRLVTVMQFLKHDAQCKFEQVCDITCVDYLNFPKAADRYGASVVNAYFDILVRYGDQSQVLNFKDLK